MFQRAESGITSAGAPANDELIESSLERPDRMIASIFITGAAVIIAWLDPIYLRFESRPIETAALVALGIVMVWWGTLARRDTLLYLGVAELLLTSSVEAITQPAPLNIPVVAVWPLRIMLVLLVGISWAFLMRPPRWLKRALMATILPTLLVFGLWGGPATGAALFGWNVPVPVTNFTPGWLAVDSQNTVYATDASGDLIWVFDESGISQGTIRAVRAPQVGMPGPGILPNGLIEELNLTNVSLFPTSTPLTSTLGIPVLDFCGIATDPSDNIYTIDSVDPNRPTLLRFNREGTITGRMATPPTYITTRNCIAADAEHIYLASGTGHIYILDHEGNVQQEARVAFQPLGMSPTGNGELLVTNANFLNTIDISTAQVMTTTLPPPPSQLRIPYQGILVRKNGEILVSDWGGNRVIRIDPETNKMVGSIGGPGAWPGQFNALGGLAEDKEGRIYVADSQHRVIQRFTPDGKIDALLWSARTVPEGANGEVEREP